MLKINTYFLPDLKKQGLTVILIGLLLIGTMSCQKDFLEQKPDKAVLVPQTLTDLRALLDNTALMNLTPGLQVISGDEFFTEESNLATFQTPVERNSYTWQDDLYEGKTVSDWNAPYKQIFYANVVLEQLQELKAGDKVLQAKNMKGAALFYRAFAYFQLTQFFR